MQLKLYHGDASQSDADADLVFAHLHGPLPPQLIGKPALINVYGPAKAIARSARWTGAEISPISTWGHGQNNTLCAANVSVTPIDLTDLVEDEGERKNDGFMPLELPLRILRVYGRPGITVWNGFMGRGTIGKACAMLGMNYIGIDNDRSRVEMARAYLASWT